MERFVERFLERTGRHPIGIAAVFALVVLLFVAISAISTRWPTGAGIAGAIIMAAIIFVFVILRNWKFGR